MDNNMRNQFLIKDFLTITDNGIREEELQLVNTLISEWNLPNNLEIWRTVTDMKVQQLQRTKITFIWNVGWLAKTMEWIFFFVYVVHNNTYNIIMYYTCN